MMSNTSPFAFTGRIGRITVDLGQGTVTPEAVRNFGALMAQRAREGERPVPAATPNAPSAPAAAPPAAAQPPRR